MSVRYGDYLGELSKAAGGGGGGTGGYAAALLGGSGGGADDALANDAKAGGKAELKVSSRCLLLRQHE